jgi:GNAT superfamily N-acetyltransferase
MNILIEPVRPEEIPVASAVLGKAYVTSPLNVAVFGENLRPNEALMKFLLEFMTGAQFYIARESGQIVGVMGMTEWPHCQQSSSETPMPPALLKEFRGSRLRMKKWHQTWAERDPKEHHWHFGPFGVLPERQRQGIGSQLFTYFCEHVDRLGAAAYLETDKPENLRLYQRFDFIVTAEAPVLGVPNWFMWRPPRQDRL